MRGMRGGLTRGGWVDWGRVGGYKEVNQVKKDQEEGEGLL